MEEGDWEGGCMRGRVLMEGVTRNAREAVIVESGEVRSHIWNVLQRAQ